MNAIPANAPVTLTASGQGGSLLATLESFGLSSGVSELETNIKSTLRLYGLFPVSVDLKATNMLPAPTWPWNGTIIVRPTYDTDSDTLRDQVASAIQDASGYAPSVAWNSTGRVDDADAANADNNLLPDPIAKLLNELKKDATWIAIGGVGLVALIVVAVAYGPNIKKLASVNL